MLNYISLFPNQYEEAFNDKIILGVQDKPITDFVIMAMQELEVIDNIVIEDIQVVSNQDEVDLDKHSVNINFKRKDLDSIVAPKYKPVAQSRNGEIIFTVRLKTNINERVIKKHLLYPIEHDGVHWNNGRRMKAIWQLVDASTYSQRGKSTLKSRMPIIIYQNKRRLIQDVNNETFVMPSYSYALNTKSKRPGSKVRTKFINPLMIYCAKMGFKNTVEFFGMEGIIHMTDDFDDKWLENNYVFPVDEVNLIVSKHLYDTYDLVKAFVCMTCNMKSKVFPLTYDFLEDREYWICRIGTVGSAKNKNMLSFREKGMTTIYMVERLLDNTTINNLRLPMQYKHNIYQLMYWMITNFDELRARSNIDMRSKRIRRNEYIVNSSLGRKINENINKIIERRGKTKLSTMDSLLEIFNFSSDILLSGMRNLNDLIKTDDIVNDMDFLQDLSFSSKGFQSLGENNSKMIAAKYRFVHPSMVGVVDLNVSSNSDVGMSGSFVPTVELYDDFYFTPEHEPCGARYQFDKALKEVEGMDIELNVKDFDTYLEALGKHDKFEQLLAYERILIIEKQQETMEEMTDGKFIKPEDPVLEDTTSGDAAIRDIIAADVKSEA